MNFKSLKIIDFDDSFVHNIAYYCFLYGADIEIIHWKDWTFENDAHVLLGAGPAHINQYPHILKETSLFLKYSKYKILGICLGHQIIHKALGYNMALWKRPIHGQSFPLPLSFWEWVTHGEMEHNFGQNYARYKVQFYNSWGVEYRKEKKVSTNIYIYNGEIWAGQGHNYLSYQFHPESIGTTCPKKLFCLFLEKLKILG